MAPRRSSTQLTLARIWAFPLWRCVLRSTATNDVIADIDWWVRCIDSAELLEFDRYTRFAFLAGALTEFRNLVHFRLRGLPTPVRLVLRRLYPPEPTLILVADSIGPALFIQHGLATIVTAQSIGSNCWINQLVTIGHDAAGRPTLGDRVRVGAGAVVLGPITVHDDATVGANATVIHDVGPGETVVAPLATPLRRPRSSADESSGEPMPDPE